MWIIIVCCCIVLLLVILLLLLVPFPSWNTYFTLGKYALFDRESSLDLQSRLKQVGYLFGYTLRLPLFALLWCLDDVIFPEYRHIAIHRPVFIVCQPRSGSTFLHRTLATDQENFVSVRNIDFLYPSILVQKILKFTGRFERFNEVSAWGSSEYSKVAEEMHPSLLLDYEEDDFLFSEFFLHHFFMTIRFPFLKLFDYLVSKPSPKLEEKMLQTHRKLMQKMLYLSGGDRIYLSKTTESHTRLTKLAELYPDALFIALTRDADQCMNSELAQVSSTSNCTIGIDVYNIPNWGASHLTYRVTSSHLQIELFESLLGERKLCLSYDLFTKNIADTVKIIYDVLGLTVGDNLQQYLNQLQESQNIRERGYKTGNSHFSELEFYQKFVEHNEKEHADLLNKGNRSGGGRSAI